MCKFKIEDPLIECRNHEWIIENLNTKQFERTTTTKEGKKTTNQQPGKYTIGVLNRSRIYNCLCLCHSIAHFEIHKIDGNNNEKKTAETSHQPIHKIDHTTNHSVWMCSKNELYRNSVSTERDRATTNVTTSAQTLCVNNWLFVSIFTRFVLLSNFIIVSLNLWSILHSVYDIRFAVVVFLLCEGNWMFQQAIFAFVTQLPIDNCPNGKRDQIVR